MPELLKFEEPEALYHTSNLVFKDEVFQIIGICMEVHRILGKGFHEIVYKDAMEYEFKQKSLAYSREEKFRVHYKDTVLPRSYNADFVFEYKIILEVKAKPNVLDTHFKQTLNYLAAAKIKLALIINFGEDSLKFKRIIL
jgi:GxxExxY protein